MSSTLTPPFLVLLMCEVFMRQRPAPVLAPIFSDSNVLSLYSPSGVVVQWLESTAMQVRGVPVSNVLDVTSAQSAQVAVSYLPVRPLQGGAWWLRVQVQFISAKVLESLLSAVRSAPAGRAVVFLVFDSYRTALRVRQQGVVDVGFLFRCDSESARLILGEFGDRVSVRQAYGFESQVGSVNAWGVQVRPLEPSVAVPVVRDYSASPESLVELVTDLRQGVVTGSSIEGIRALLGASESSVVDVVKSFQRVFFAGSARAVSLAQKNCVRSVLSLCESQGYRSAYWKLFLMVADVFEVRSAYVLDKFYDEPGSVFDTYNETVRKSRFEVAYPNSRYSAPSPGYYKFLHSLFSGSPLAVWAGYLSLFAPSQPVSSPWSSEFDALAFCYRLFAVADSLRDGSDMSGKSRGRF